MEKIIEIPEGYEARIEGNKVVLEQKESEDERIRKELVQFLKDYPYLPNGEHTRADFFAWLEKQKEQQELPLMGEDTDLYFDEWKQRFKGNPTKRQCFEEGIRYSERKQKEPEWCHHKVDLSGCSEEYRKAYYDGWNNCNQQHSQLQAERKPAEWNEVDYEGEIEDLCDGSMSLTSKDIARHFYELGQRCHKPTEWSEEDEQWLESIIKDYEDSLVKDKDHATIIKIKIDFLKSIKDRMQSKPYWKPSEEQVQALWRAVEYLDESDNEDFDIIENLYSELTKLM